MKFLLDFLKSTKDKKIFVYQIYYDDISRQQLDPGFIPLDNMTNSRPDWYDLGDSPVFA